MMVMRKGYPARADALPCVRAAATGCVRELGVEESVAQAVALAVTEACTNVVLHAYRHQEEPGEMTVLVEKPDDHLCVTVLDEGMGMVPRSDSPGMGMGLPLISQFSESVELRSRAEGGSEVSMRFPVAPKRSAASA
jgi:anti-sigma regulatory factor (Ser/Thr protein kinase)